MSGWREAAARTPRRLADAAKIAAAAREASERGLPLRYEGPGANLVEESAALTTADLLAGGAASEDVLLTTAPATAEDAAAAAEACGDRRAVVTVDHFAHVELIAAAPWRRPPGLAIELSLGPTRFGGRPGRDAVDLASVIAQTDGVELAGVTAAVGSRGMAEALERAVEQLEAEGLAAPLVSVACGPDEYAGLVGGRCEVRNDAGAAAGVAVRVIARPTLETCAVDAGAEAGLTLKRRLGVAKSPGRPIGEARVRAAERGRALLSLDEGAADVLIGEAVILDALDGGPLGTGLPAAVFGP